MRGKIHFSVMSLLLLILISGCRSIITETPLPEPTPENTPTPSPLEIDGTIYPGEWNLAESNQLTDSSNLYLLQSGDILYLAVEGSTSHLLGGNIFLAQGDTVRILHISAALGTAEYIQDGESWSLVRNFEWKHRLANNSEVALAERQAYQDLEGWSAPNANTGTPNHLEMQIRLGKEPARLAISLFRSNSNNRLVWPDDINDDSGNTFSGGLPPSLYLEPENWYHIP